MVGNGRMWWIGAGWRPDMVSCYFLKFWKSLQWVSQIHGGCYFRTKNSCSEAWTPSSQFWSKVDLCIAGRHPAPIYHIRPFPTILAWAEIHTSAWRTFKSIIKLKSVPPYLAWVKPTFHLDSELSVHRPKFIPIANVHTFQSVSILPTPGKDWSSKTSETRCWFQHMWTVYATKATTQEQKLKCGIWGWNYEM